MNVKYEQVCETLQQSVCFTNVPKYNINPDVGCDEETLKEKVSYRCRIWKERVPENVTKLDFRCLGSCEIGNLTGNEIIRMFFDIFENKQLQRGNYICFSTNSKQCAVVWFEKYIPVVITLTPPKDSVWKYSYTKIFDDEKVEKNRKEGTKRNFSEEDVNSFRQQAKIEYYKFWKTKFADFDLHPFGAVFFGLAADIAKHSGRSKYSLQRYHADVGKVPFAACVKLAFDANMTGKITKLFGELRFIVRKKESEMIQQKSECICKTACYLISRLV